MRTGTASVSRAVLTALLLASPVTVVAQKPGHGFHGQSAISAGPSSHKTGIGVPFSAAAATAAPKTLPAAAAAAQDRSASFNRGSSVQSDRGQPGSAGPDRSTSVRGSSPSSDRGASAFSDRGQSNSSDRGSSASSERGRSNTLDRGSSGSDGRDQSAASNGDSSGSSGNDISASASRESDDGASETRMLQTQASKSKFIDQLPACR